MGEQEEYRKIKGSRRKRRGRTDGGVGGGEKGEYPAQQVGLDVKMFQSMEQTDLKDEGFKTQHERMKKQR